MNLSFSKQSYKAHGVLVGRLVLSDGLYITPRGLRLDLMPTDGVLVYHGMDEPPGLTWVVYGDLEAMPERIEK